MIRINVSIQYAPKTPSRFKWVSAVAAVDTGYTGDVILSPAFAARLSSKQSVVLVDIGKPHTDAQNRVIPGACTAVMMELTDSGCTPAMATAFVPDLPTLFEAGSFDVIVGRRPLVGANAELVIGNVAYPVATDLPPRKTKRNPDAEVWPIDVPRWYLSYG